MSQDVKKKILIRGVNWIGDAVLTIPSIRAVRKAFPDAHISLLVKPWVSDIFRNNPDIDEIILYEDAHKGIGGKLKLAGELRKKKFDTAILLQNAFDAALIMRLAGVPERIGYRRDGRAFLLTRAIPLNKDILSLHQIYYYLNLLKSIGLETKEVQPFIWLADEERQWARDLINSKFIPTHSGQNSKLLIGINPGATYGSAKRWPPERFAELIVRIINALDGSVIIFGSEAEAEIANEIVASVGAPPRGCPSRGCPGQGTGAGVAMAASHPGQAQGPAPTGILNMAGKTNLRQLAALIAECDAFITNDSGPMHIASALFVPVVAIFGSTDKTATGPFGEGHKAITKSLACSPCMKRECPERHLRCMTEITADEVFDALKGIVAREKAVFLDRDGTVIEDKNYLNSFDNLVIFKDSKESMRKLKDAGFKLIGVTNQSGIARGIIEEKFVIELNAYLQKELGIDTFYYCPHHPDEHCPCRKPEPLMPLTARLKHKINVKTSYMIGDKELDVKLAWEIGATGVLLSSSPAEDTCASYVAKDLTEAVRWIVKREKSLLGRPGG